MIVNLQRKIRLDAKTFKPFVADLILSVEEAEGCEIAVAFVSDRRMKELNKFFRGKDSTTDVLSFPHEPDEYSKLQFADQNESSKLQFADQNKHSKLKFAGHKKRFLGDIVISVEQAKKQAEENGLTFEAEIKQLMLHGVLHLCGYDHETDNGEMNERELRLRDKLGL